MGVVTAPAGASQGRSHSKRAGQKIRTETSTSGRLRPTNEWRRGVHKADFGRKQLDCLVLVANQLIFDLPANADKSRNSTLLSSDGSSAE